MELSNYYYLLNVEQSADIKDIIKSYRNLARLSKTNNIIKSYYPQIKLAYIVLSNPESRKEYDKQLQEIKDDYNNIDSDCIENDIVYSQFDKDNENNEELKKINKTIHCEQNISNIEKLRAQELNILYSNVKQ